MTPFDFARTLCLSRETTKAEMVVAYAAILADLSPPETRHAEVASVNARIIQRWSRRGLHDIKVGAWKIARRKRDATVLP